MKLVVRQAVIDQVADVSAYYETKRAGLGQAYEDRFEETVLLIIKVPHAQVLYDNVRARLMRQFPYKVFYLVDEAQQVITILAVLHNARDPAIWPTSE